MINKIEGTGPLRASQPVRRLVKSGEAGGASFSKSLEETESAEGAAASGVSSLGNVAGVFGLQEVDDALARASRGKMRAQDILDKLDEMRLDLLSGGMSREKLQRLAKTINTRRQDMDDPRLGEILDEIDLRAQVELAKFGG